MTDGENFSGVCPLCGQKSRADEIERLRAALKAQQDATDALNGRVGYEEYQALQDKADALRAAALNPH